MTTSQTQVASSPTPIAPHIGNGTFETVSLLLLVPIAILGTILGHKQYRKLKYRRRIELLEKLWALDSRSHRQG